MYAKMFLEKKDTAKKSDQFYPQTHYTHVVYMPYTRLFDDEMNGIMQQRSLQCQGCMKDQIYLFR